MTQISRDEARRLLRQSALETAQQQTAELEDEAQSPETGISGSVQRNTDLTGLGRQLGLDQASHNSMLLPDLGGIPRAAKGAAEIINDLFINKPMEASARGGERITGAVDQMRQGNIAGGLEEMQSFIGTDLPATVPVLGPMAVDLSQRAQSGDVSGALMDLAFMAPFGLPAPVGRALR